MLLNSYPSQDTAHLSLHDGEFHRTVMIDDQTHMGVDADGRALWVSLLSVSTSANLEALNQDQKDQAMRLLGEIQEEESRDETPPHSTTHQRNQQPDRQKMQTNEIKEALNPKCSGSSRNHSPRHGSNRCTKTATRELPMCTRHYNIQVRTLRIREWQEENQIACPEHPGNTLRINSRAKTLTCPAQAGTQIKAAGIRGTTTTPIWCRWTHEISERAWRGGLEWAGRHQPA